MYAGVDEAGRGPLLGPMVVAGVIVDDIHSLTTLGVKDSKRLTPERRIELSEGIREVARVAVRVIDAEEINERGQRETLNDMTRTAFQDVLRELQPRRAWIDLCGPNAGRWASTVRAGLTFDCEVYSEKRADSLYPTVSAASIIAKVERDERIAKMAQMYGECGSGYPSDERTIRFVTDWVAAKGELPPFVRLRWKTTKRWMDTPIADR